jgi:hypothetical protein
MEMTIKTLREMIVEQVLCEKALAKDAWQDHLRNYLKGAIREFYKARLGEKNSIAVQQDINQWMMEVESHLDSFVEVYFNPIKGKQSKKSAYGVVRSNMVKIDAERRRKATNIMLRYYEKRIPSTGLIPLNDDDTLAFWNLVQQVIDEHDM